MDDSFYRIIYVLTDLIAPLVVGYFLNQKKLISGETCNKLIKFNVIGVYTILSLLSFWVLPLSWNLLWLPFLGFTYVLFPGAVGALFFARKFNNLLDRGAYIMSAMLSNIGTLGGVCAFILYNEAGFAYAQIVGTCQNIMLVLVCFPLAQYYYLKHSSGLHKSSPKTSFCELFFSRNQISLLGMTAGLLLNYNGVARPDFLGPVFQSLVHIGAWTAMLPVGLLINFKRAYVFYNRIWDLVPIRFILVPLYIYFASRLFFTDKIMLNTLFIIAATPTAINAVLASRLYKLNVNLAVSSFIMTTTIFLFIIFPLMFVFLR